MIVFEWPRRLRPRSKYDGGCDIPHPRIWSGRVVGDRVQLNPISWFSIYPKMSNGKINWWAIKKYQSITIHCISTCFDDEDGEREMVPLLLHFSICLLKNARHIKLRLSP